MKCREINDLLLTAKADYDKSKMAECGKDHKAIFRVINELLRRNTGETFPDDTGVQSDLPQKISDFFTDKIYLIRQKLDSYSVDKSGLSSVKFQSFLDAYSQSDQLSSFCVLSDAAVEKLIVSRPTKHSQLDPIPTWLLKENSKELLSHVWYFSQWLEMCYFSTIAEKIQSWSHDFQQSKAHKQPSIHVQTHWISCVQSI